jgi:hypothetical protein
MRQKLGKQPNAFHPIARRLPRRVQQAVEEGAELGGLTYEYSSGLDGNKKDLAGGDDDLAAQALSARQEPPL